MSDATLLALKLQEDCGIDVATDEVETPEQVAAVIGEAMKYVPREKIIASTRSRRR